jgi:acyl carrier protein
MSPVQTAVTAVLALAELALALQEALGVPVAEDEAAKHSTVGDLVATLNAKRA